MALSPGDPNSYSRPDQVPEYGARVTGCNCCLDHHQEPAPGARGGLLQEGAGGPCDPQPGEGGARGFSPAAGCQQAPRHGSTGQKE